MISVSAGDREDLHLSAPLGSSQTYPAYLNPPLINKVTANCNDHWLLLSPSDLYTIQFYSYYLPSHEQRQRPASRVNQANHIFWESRGVSESWLSIVKQSSAMTVTSGCTHRAQDVSTLLTPHHPLLNQFHRD